MKTFTALTRLKPGGARLRFAELAIFGLLAASAMAIAPPEPMSLDAVFQDLPTRTLQGLVRTSEGDAASGADVLLYYARGQYGLRDRVIARATADAAGRFVLPDAIAWEPVTELRDPPQQACYVVARHAKAGVGCEVVRPGEATDDLRITLQPLESVSITVLNEAEEPVEGARVYLAEVPTPPSGQTYERLEPAVDAIVLYRDTGLSSGLTNEDGLVLLNAPARADRFRVEKAGYVPELVAAGRVVLQRSASLSGQVTTESGDAIPGAAVWYRYHGEQDWVTVTTTDATGAYAFPDVPGLGYGGTQQNRGGGLAAPIAESITRPITERLTAPIPEAITRPITERLTAPIPEAITRPITERLAPGAGPRNGPKESAAPNDAPTGDSPHIEVSVQDLRLHAPFLPKHTGLQLAPAQRARQDFALERGAVVAGKVVDLVTNEAIPGIHLAIDFFPDLVEVTTDSRGQFSAAVKPGAEVTINYAAGNYLIRRHWDPEAGGSAETFRQVVTQDIGGLVLGLQLLPVNALSGRVIDAGGKGVPGAIVHLHYAAPTVATDADGNFLLPVVPTDREFDLLAISSDGSQAGVLSVRKGSTLACVPIEAVHDYDLEVVDADSGNPAGPLAMQVLYLWLNNGPLFLTPRNDLTTDDRGHLTIENLIPGATYRAEWVSDERTNPSFASSTALVDLSKADGDNRVRLPVRRFTRSLRGIVTTARGEPVPGASVEVLSAEMAPRYVQSEKLVTDTDGNFAVGPLASGDVSLRISAETYKSRVVSISSSTESTRVVLEPVLAGSRYAAVVTDANGNTLSGAPVLFRYVVYENGLKRVEALESQTDESGRVEFLFRPESERAFGSGIIGCDWPPWNVDFRSATLNEDTEARLELQRDTPRWSGRVVAMATREPILNARVVVHGVRKRNRPANQGSVTFRAEFGLVYESRADADGRFVVDRFSSRDGLGVHISAPGFAREYLFLDPEGAREELVCELMAGGGVQGQAVMPDGAPAPAGLDIALRAKGESRTCTTDAQGRFALDDLRPATYQVRYAPLATPDVQQFAQTEPCSFTLEAGETANVTLSFAEASPVRGRIVDPATGKAPQVRMGVNAYNQAGHFVANAILHQDGSWVLYLPPGTFDIQFFVGSRRGSFRSLSIEQGKAYENVVIEASPLPDTGNGSLPQAPPLDAEALRENEPLSPEP